MVGAAVTRGAVPQERARVRREPRQARSRARVAQILAAADGILSREGFEALTVRRIAQEAAVPVGSIYQFFPDKAAVVDALAHGYIGEFDAAIAHLVEGAEDPVDGRAWADPVGRLVDEFANLYRSRPGYVALWSGRHLSPELARADDTNNLAIAAGVRRILVARGILHDGPDLERNAQVAVRVADSLLQFAFAGAADGDELVLQELKTLLRLYLTDLAAR
ncbi:TetR/AcrR family transcriptional regulator [Actinospica sp.]|uniref:TetR/AcrR family transcriptional regulator n=1 Tax=Actinospica sp. TaxID=1872142 RepID=UPI002B928C67|nr:TetR/AcrR family transcriptional regulator [Actinospica sp.]HWG25839.1 TetR/AcrR family transcriptional regulator [Actinospica sp.]